MIKLVIVDRKDKGIYGGGDVHIDILSKIFQEKFGIEVTRIMIPFDGEFNLLTNFISLIRSLLYKIDEKQRELYHKSIILAPNPYLNYVVIALKTSRLTKCYPVVYFHHLSVSLKFIRRRGIIRSLMNYYMNLIALSICKIMDVPIFLDNPSSQTLKGFDIFKDEDAPDQLISTKEFDVKKEFDLCYIGRFEKHKGAIDIINVAKILKRDSINVKIAIVGHIGDRFKKKVLRILKTNDLLDCFIFFGTVNKTEKLKILFSSRVYLHLSYEEGWGMSVMDAASAGIPIIAYDLPAYSYLQGKYNKVKVGDIKLVAKAIKDVLCDYSNAVSVSAEAKKVVDNYNYDDIAAYQVRCYEIITDNGGKYYSD